MQININTWWVFVGPGGGSGIAHKVIHIAGAGELITWSMNDPQLGSGWSWMGSAAEFLKQFKPI